MEIHSADDFHREMNHLLTDKEALQKAGRAAGHYICDNAGATEKIIP